MNSKKSILNQNFSLNFVRLALQTMNDYSFSKKIAQF